MKYTALSVKQPHAGLIATGRKHIETRVWSTKYRGDLLIVSSLGIDRAACERLSIVRRGHTMKLGKALCIAELVDCRAMTKDDEVAACCELYDGTFAWVLENIRPVEPFGVKGKLRLYKVECEELIFKKRS